MNSYLEVAIEAALEGGKILLAEFDRPVNISYKGEVDIVTQADRRSEQAVVVAAAHPFPRSHHRGRRGRRGRVRRRPSAGTWTRWTGPPISRMAIRASRSPLGWRKPGNLWPGRSTSRSRRELFTAAKGEGAYLNENRIKVSPIEKLATSLLATGFPSVKRAHSPNIHYYWDFTMRSHGVRRDGSAAMDLAAVASGRFDGFWEFGLHPWDTAAGVLLVREAGGTATTFFGKPYRPGDLGDFGLQRPRSRGDARGGYGHRRRRLASADAPR